MPLILQALIQKGKQDQQRTQNTGAKDFITFSSLSVLSEFKEKIVSYHWIFPVGLSATVAKPQGTGQAVPFPWEVRAEIQLAICSCFRSGTRVSNATEMCESLNFLPILTAFSFSKLTNNKTYSFYWILTMCHWLGCFLSIYYLIHHSPKQIMRLILQLLSFLWRDQATK